jgi:hypothetical protein
MGDNPGAAEDDMSAADESAVEEAVHGADAEIQNQAAVEATDPSRPAPRARAERRGAQRAERDGDAPRAQAARWSAYHPSAEWST